MPDYHFFSPDRLVPFVDFWNRTFADRRNFVALTPEAFTRRVLGAGNAVEAFDPRGLLLAVEGTDVVGAVHSGIWPEPYAQVIEPGRKGGPLGYIALIAVDPARRRHGIGRELWLRTTGHLRDCSGLRVDGRCFNPFYGNSDGPATPFWGTPEGIGIRWEDGATCQFLRRRGFKARHRAEHLQWTPLAKEMLRPKRFPQGIDIRPQEGVYPEPGRLLTDPPRYETDHPFTCMTAVDETGRTAGLLSFYPLQGLPPGRFAVYEWLVAEDRRNTGIGEALMRAALRRLRGLGATSCDALTIPEISPAAHSLYLRAGFRPVDAWAIY